MVKVGKVNNYDGINGTIVSNDGEYNFIKSELNNPNVKKGDLVKFSSNENEDFKIAYFIEPINIYELTEDVKTLLLKNGNNS